MNARKINKERGASIIEFAFVAFIFFLIMWGIFDFARALYVRNTTQHLTRCIAREAVVIKPSQFNAAKASCLMQMGGSGSNYYWPLYHLNPGDMRSDFRVRYVFQDGTWEEQPPNDSLDDQVKACAEGPDECIAYVQVYVLAGTVLEDFGLLRTWLRRSATVNEPFASTMMPAESMGYAPP